MTKFRPCHRGGNPSPGAPATVATNWSAPGIIEGKGNGRPRVLYLSRTGILEPLGLSQVLRYLLRLSADYSITLVTFERADDLGDAPRVAEMRQCCNTHGIRWLPQRYRKRIRGQDALADIGRMVWVGLRESRNGGFGLTHARSYLPAIAAALLGRITGTPFVFDMRALWPEELITAGRLRRGSLTHSLLVSAERHCLRRAAEVVSLTHAAVRYLAHAHPDVVENHKITVIPTCVDLSLFVPMASDGPRVYGCLGSVESGWFRLDWLAAFFSYVAQREVDAYFEVVTRDDTNAVRAAMVGAGVPSERLAIYATTPFDAPAAICRQHVNVMFYRCDAPSELGRSPTRLGEVLACGVPVIANRGVGDVAEVIDAERVGVLVNDVAPAALKAAYEDFLDLRRDPELPMRCRRAAEEIFSLQAGTRAYRTLYRRHTGGGELL